MYEYSIIKETEKALLIEFNAYKGVKEELIKLNTWIPKAWTKKENDYRVGQNIEKALNEHSEKIKSYMMNKGYGHKGCKFSLKKAVVKKATHKYVDYYFDASFFPKDINGDVLEEIRSLNDDFKTKYIADIVVNKLDGFFYINSKGELSVSDYSKIEKAKELGFEILELKDIKIYKRLTKKIENCYLWTRRREKI